MEGTSFVSTICVIFILISNASASQPEEYQGCYFHIFYTPALGKQFATKQSNTGDVCKNICKSKAYKLAGVRSGECYCDNSVRTQKFTSGCDIVCPGRATEKCGGLFRVSVYSVEAEESQTTTLPTNSSVYTTEDSSNTTNVPKPQELEASSSPAVTFLLILAIMSIIVIAAYIAVRRRHLCMGGTYSINRNNSLKRYFDSTNGNYERHIDDVNKLPDVTRSGVTRPAFTNTNSLEENTNTDVSSFDMPIYAKVNKERIPVSKQVYNHIKDHHKPAVDKTYSPLSPVGKDIRTNKVIDTYSHISKKNTDGFEDEQAFKKDQSYNTLHAVVRPNEGEQINDDFSTIYDSTFAFNHDEMPVEVDEYSHTNNDG